MIKQTKNQKCIGQKWKNDGKKGKQTFAKSV